MMSEACMQSLSSPTLFEACDPCECRLPPPAPQKPSKHCSGQLHAGASHHHWNTLDPMNSFLRVLSYAAQATSFLSAV